MVMAEEIQPGWRVVDSNGEEVGTVVAAEGPSLKIRRHSGGEVMVPNEACSYIETGRVELTMSKKDLDALQA